VPRLLCFLFMVGVSFDALSQQNLFNVPSSDITLKAHPFFQQQFNFGNGMLQSNTTFSWGLGGEAEVGFNILGVSFQSGQLLTNTYKKNPPVYPFYTLNFQKAFTLNKTFKLAVGTQSGYSQGFHFGGYAYSNLVTVIPKIQSKLITGLYYGSDGFLGPGDRNPLFPSESDPIGFQIGLEQEVIKEKLVLLAEGISGKHAYGLIALGMAYHVTHHWVLSGGYQFSNQGSSSANSLVIEFTYIPSATVTKHIFRRGHHEATEE